MDGNQYLTPPAVAERYPGLTVRWLARRRWERVAPSYVKAGKRVLYRISDIEAFLAASTREMTDPPLNGGHRV